MLEVVLSNRFKKDLKLAARRGLPLDELNTVVDWLAAGQALPDLRGRALIELQGFFQKMQRVRVHRPGGGGRQEKQGTVGLLMRTEIAVQRVIGKPPALMHAVARHGQRVARAAVQQQNVHTRRNAGRKRGIVGNENRATGHSKAPAFALALSRAGRFRDASGCNPDA